MNEPMIFTYAVSIIVIIVTIVASPILAAAGAMPSVTDIGETNLIVSSVTPSTRFLGLADIEIVQGSSLPENKVFYRPAVLEAGIGSTMLIRDNNSVTTAN